MFSHHLTHNSSSNELKNASYEDYKQFEDNEYKSHNLTKLLATETEHEFRQQKEIFLQNAQTDPILVSDKELLSGKITLFFCRKVGLTPNITDINSESNKTEGVNLINLLYNHRIQNKMRDKSIITAEGVSLALEAEKISDNIEKELSQFNQDNQETRDKIIKKLNDVFKTTNLKSEDLQNKSLDEIKLAYKKAEGVGYLTRDILAKNLGVSTGYISMAKTLCHAYAKRLEGGELFKEVLAGDMTLNKAHKEYECLESVQTRLKEEQKQILEYNGLQLTDKDFEEIQRIISNKKGEGYAYKKVVSSKIKSLSKALKSISKSAHEEGIIISKNELEQLRSEAISTKTSMDLLQIKKLIEKLNLWLKKEEYDLNKLLNSVSDYKSETIDSLLQKEKKRLIEKCKTSGFDIKDVVQGLANEYLNGGTKHE